MVHQAPPAAEATAAASSAEFSWTKQWYPVAVLSDLDPKEPFATKLLGRDLVVWRDAGGKWRCFEDKCPHRLAPLSEGRIEPSDGTLQCSYHGWRFGGDGRPAAIPQAGFDSPKVEKTACGSRRGCVAAFPTAEARNMLFVWGEAGPMAQAESSGAPLPINPRVGALKDDDVVVFTNQHYVRDFPIAHDILLENTSDQSHVPWAHHGVASNRSSPWAAHFMVNSVNKDLPEGADGYSYRLQWSPDAINPPIDQVVTYSPPCYLEYLTEGENGTFTALWFYVVPLDDNNTRIISHSVSTRPLQVPSLVTGLLGKRPAWIDHLVLTEVFDGDLPNLIKAAWYAKQTDRIAGDWARSYYLPASADRSVLAMRNWYQGRGRGGFSAAAGRVPEPPPRELPREVLLDRLHQHTCKCKSCFKALNQLRSSQVVLKTLAVGALLTTAAILGHADSPLDAGALSSAAVAATALWLSAQAHKAEALFIFKDYNHAQR